MRIATLQIALAATTNMTFLRAVGAFTSSSLRTTTVLSRHRILAASPFSTAVPSNLDGRSTFLLRKNQPPGLEMSSSEPSEIVTADAAANDLDQYRNHNNIRDQVFSAISADGGIKVTAATVRNIVNEMMIRHTMTAVPADAIGRAVTCCVLISNGMQKEQVFQMTIDGDGPLRGVVAISSGSGEVRGYVGNPGIGDMALEEAVGKGVIKVVKNHPSWPVPYNGISAIRNSDIDRDVGAYLAESEQRSCALAAATSVEGILCHAAGGYLVEKLPECPESTMKRVEENLAKLVEKDGGDKLPTNLLLSGVAPLEIAEIILDGLDMQPLQQIEPIPKCQCSEERLFRSLRLLPREEVDQIVEEQEVIEARCQFCGRVYRMGPEEVEEKFKTASGDPSIDDEANL